MTVPIIEAETDPIATQTGILITAEAQAQEQVENSTVASILALWATFNAYWSGDAVKAFADAVATITVRAQGRAGRITEASLRRQFARIGSDLPTGVVSLPDALRLGANPSDVYQRPVRKLRYLISEGTPQAEAIQVASERIDRQVRTDLQLARTYAAQQAYYESPQVRGYRRIIHPELGSVCGLCIAAADRIYQRIEKLDVHPGCVLEGTEVSASGTRALTRRWYAGPVVVLRTRSGQELRVTPNHPVLTDHGWVRADGLRQGDRVVSRDRFHGPVRRGPDEVERPARVEDLWRALTMAEGLLPCTVPLSPEDLHGDAAGQGEVDVVLVDRHLPSVGDVSFIEPCRELSLVDAHGGWVGLTGERTGLELLDRLWLPSDSLVGSSGGPLAVAGSPLVAAHGSLGPITQGYFSAPEVPGDGGAGYAEVGRQLLDRLTGQVELDELVSVDVFAWSGHVFNLETEEGWYGASSIVVSNCKCTTLPIIGSKDPGLSLHAEDLRRIYAAAGNTTDGRALSKVRIQVGQHGELGPILMADGVEFKDNRTAVRQLSSQAADLRRKSIQSQLDSLRARANPNQWILDRIEQLEELASAA